MAHMQTPDVYLTIFQMDPKLDVKTFWKIDSKIVVFSQFMFHSSSFNETDLFILTPTHLKNVVYKQ